MRIILCLLIAIVAAPAWAEWVSVGEDNKATGYIDPATISKNGNFRKVWQLQDLKERGKDGAMSRRVLWEYDCNEGRDRMLSISTYSEPMARGAILSEFDPGESLTHITPNSRSAIIIKIVCAK